MRPCVVICVALALGVALVLGYLVAFAVLMGSILNAAMPMMVQAAVNEWLTLMFLAIVVTAISLAFLICGLGSDVTHLLFAPGPDGVVFFSGFFILVEALKVLLGPSP